MTTNLVTDERIKDHLDLLHNYRTNLSRDRSMGWSGGPLPYRIPLAKHRLAGRDTTCNPYHSNRVIQGGFTNKPKSFYITENHLSSIISVYAETNGTFRPYYHLWQVVMHRPVWTMHRIGLLT